MNEVNKYSVQINNGNKLLTIHLTATGKDVAKQIILDTENCPESAIRSIIYNGPVIRAAS